jgi:hypothetical protein
MGHPNTDKLRRDGNRPEETDRLEAVEPPASPLVTDGEPHNMPPSRYAIKQAYDQEIFGRRVSPARHREDYAIPIFLAVVATVLSFVVFSLWMS